MHTNDDAPNPQGPVLPCDEESVDPFRGPFIKKDFILFIVTTI